VINPVDKLIDQRNFGVSSRQAGAPSIMRCFHAAFVLVTQAFSAVSPYKVLGSLLGLHWTFEHIPSSAALRGTLQSLPGGFLGLVWRI
jgi:hypothetical protein